MRRGRAARNAVSSKVDQTPVVVTKRDGPRPPPLTQLGLADGLILGGSRLVHQLKPLVRLQRNKYIDRKIDKIDKINTKDRSIDM